MVHTLLFPGWHSNKYPFKDCELRYHFMVFNMLKSKDLGIKVFPVSLSFNILGTCLEGN